LKFDSQYRIETYRLIVYHTAAEADKLLSKQNKFGVNSTSDRLAACERECDAWNIFEDLLKRWRLNCGKRHTVHHIEFCSSLFNISVSAPSS
jgi:hypothetical protein